jgi:hypothetical protein
METNIKMTSEQENQVYTAALEHASASILDSSIEPLTPWLVLHRLTAYCEKNPYRSGETARAAAADVVLAHLFPETD